MKKGDKGQQVAELQIKLVHYSLGRNPMLIDGQFGDKTDFAVRQFQTQNALVVDGMAGRNTMAKINEITSEKFLVSLHGGHGGIDPNTGQYATLPSTGKRWHHKGEKFHKDGWFYEGVENRIAANAVAEELRKLGIFVLVTHHAYKCDYNNLSTHIKQTLPYIKAGYAGGTIALHSNAAPTEKVNAKKQVIGIRTQEELNQITGCYVFTSEGQTPSDPAAKITLQELKNAFGSWVRLRDKKEMATEKSNVEKNFQVLRQAEAAAAKYGNKKWFSFLIEDGFFTSVWDCKKIFENRAAYANCIVQAVFKIKNKKP